MEQVRYLYCTHLLIYGIFLQQQMKESYLNIKNVQF